jgi:hypothetical protein
VPLGSPCRAPTKKMLSFQNHLLQMFQSP